MLFDIHEAILDYNLFLTVFSYYCGGRALTEAKEICFLLKTRESELSDVMSTMKASRLLDTVP